MIGLLQKVNWVDILTLILLIRISYISSRIGVGKQILPLLLLALILTVSLHNYRIIGWFFVDQYGFRANFSLFFSYFFMALGFFVIYHIASRIAGFCFLPGEIVPGGIEKVGGTILGLVRSIFIIGLVLIALLLMPVRFVQESVKNSSLGLFYIRAGLKTYSITANLIFKKKISYKEELTELFSEEE